MGKGRGWRGLMRVRTAHVFFCLTYYLSLRSNSLIAVPVGRRGCLRGWGFVTLVLAGDLPAFFFTELGMAKVEIVAVVLTISDKASRGEREDKSGPAVVGEIEKLGGKIAATEILSDDREIIASRLRAYADRGDVNLICTTGGTGFAPRDNTPEATRDVIEKEAPGLAELMRLRSLDSTPLAPLSRAVCGIRGQALIVNLPGSLRGAVENFTAIRSSIPHAVGLLTDQSPKCAN